MHKEHFENIAWEGDPKGWGLSGLEAGFKGPVSFLYILGNTYVSLVFLHCQICTSLKAILSKHVQFILLRIEIQTKFE